MHFLGIIFKTSDFQDSFFSPHLPLQVFSEQPQDSAVFLPLIQGQCCWAFSPHHVSSDFGHVCPAPTLCFSQAIAFGTLGNDVVCFPLSRAWYPRPPWRFPACLKSQLGCLAFVMSSERLMWDALPPHRSDIPAHPRGLAWSADLHLSTGRVP